MEQPKIFTLTDIEKQGHLWKRLKKYLEDENEKDRLRNDSMSLTQEETLIIRARISIRKSLLNLDN